MGLLTTVAWLSCLHTALSVCIETCPSGGSGWSSNLRAENVDQTSAVLAWDQDDSFGMGYEIRWVRTGVVNLFVDQQNTTSLTFTLTNLQPGTVYEVEVCRKPRENMPDDCGNCTLCITTLQGPPPPPIVEPLQVNGPSSFTIIFEEITTANVSVTEYYVLCVPTAGGSAVFNSSFPAFNPPERRTFDVLQLSPSTSYDCTVAAGNEFGIGEPSPVRQATTEAITTTPGALLIAFSDRVDFARITDSTVGMPQPYTTGRRQLFNTSSTIQGIDYDFHRREIYYTTANKTLHRVIVNTDAEQLPVSVQSGPELILSVPAVEALGSVALDWVTKELYWVEHLSNNFSRIMRGSAAEDLMIRYCVVEFSYFVTHIVVDPVRGFFFWSGTEGLNRSLLRFARLANSMCPSSIPEALSLVQVPVETFMLELNNIYFIQRENCVGALPLCVSAGSLGLSRFQNFFGISEPLLAVYLNQAILNFQQSQILVTTSLTDPITNGGPVVTIRFVPVNLRPFGFRVYRDVLQPLPSPPVAVSDVNVLSTDTSAFVSWNAPTFSGIFFSPDAYSNWTYTVEYRPLGGGVWLNSNTSSLSLNLIGLMPQQLYEIDIIAFGLASEGRRLPNTLVFSTKAESNLQLLVAANLAGIISTGLGPEATPTCVVNTPGGYSGVDYDTYTGSVYWSTDGGNGRIFRRRGIEGQMEEEIATAVNPSAVKLDWVSLRLFWVTTNPRQIVSVFPEDSSSTVETFQPLSSAGINQEPVAMDSLNGFLFWVSDASIQRRMLNGYGPFTCHIPLVTPTAIAVDPEQQRLFWLSGSGSATTLNQLDYDTVQCNPNTIQARDFDFSFGTSATATVMVYASNTLFIGSQSSTIIYSVPSEFATLPTSQSIVVGRQELTPACAGTTSDMLTPIDMAVTGRSAQPLPDGVTELSRRISTVTPSPTPDPPSQGPSTGDSIVIEWTPSPRVLPESPQLFLLNYSLNDLPHQQMFVLESTSLTLNDQEPSTKVMANVKTCSLWSCGPASQTGQFISPPPVPGVVTNMRVFVYQPLREESGLAGLLLWDAPSGSTIDGYDVVVRLNGSSVSMVYQPTDNATHHLLIQKDAITNEVIYFLQQGMTYEVEVTARNPTGIGPPSSPLSFTVNGPDYPQQVLALSSGNAQVVGMETTFVTQSTRTPLAHVVVDTVAREVYYHSTDINTIFASSLEDGSEQPLILINNRLTLLSLTYDWVARLLYYAVRAGEGRLELYQIPVFNRDSNSQVLPSLVHTLTDSATLQLSIDPFRGSLYWIQSDDNTVQLYSLGLRDNNVTTPTLLSLPNRRRRRKRTSIPLASLSLHSALTFDPVNQTILVATNNGDIVSCMTDSLQCEIAVDASVVGAPPTSIAVDDRYIYWSTNTTVLAALRTDTTVSMVISFSATDALAPLSPGAQPLGRRECLSPILNVMINRPEPEVVGVSSTSITIRWTAPQLPSPTCDDVFSFPPLLYTVFIVDLTVTPFGIVPRPHASTYLTQLEVTGLNPSTNYGISILAENLFSTRRNENDRGTGGDTCGTTGLGVPDSPTMLGHTVLGTSRVDLTWSVVQGMDIFYFIISQSGGSVQSVTPNVTLNGSIGITPGGDERISVLASNGAFNSSMAEISVSFWRLAPAPMISGDQRNTSATVNVALEMSTHGDITALAVQYCTEFATDSDTLCSCNDSEYMSNETDVMVPGNLQINITGLLAFTMYCVQSVGRYRVPDGDTGLGELTVGMGAMLMTGEGVPDAPMNVRLDASIFQWTAPNPRSTDSLTYLLLAEPVDGTSNISEIALSGDVTNRVDLQDIQALEPGISYFIRVAARNRLGTGPPSDSRSFARIAPISASDTIPIIIGVTVGGVLIIALCLCFILFCVWFIRLGRPKEMEIRSLAYMYGPDHELSNLRSAYRHEQAQNPHYTWTREDYVCTDEDLALLSKFPRHNLKLENFIDRGEFGEVYQGTAINILGDDTGPTPVAVKTLRKGAGHEDQQKFLSEASLMSNFNHPNIVKVLGVCLDNDPVYIIMELMPAGDLLKFLREAKRDHGPTLLTLTEQIQVSLDVAHGCRYLEQQHFIHRDIAARNCLVSSKGADRVVKIADFGLARDLYSSDYYQVEGQRKLPVRWMAPEALLQGKFTVESDIWSFGVLLWEIMSLGNQPYPGRINQEVLQFVTGGGRLDKPEKCPTKIYHLMQSCWKRYASERPHFEAIVTTLTNFLNRIKRPDSVYHSDSDSDPGEDETNLRRQSSTTKTPTRSPSFKSNFMNLARSGSIKLRNSFRRHGSIHKREENAISQLPVSSTENLISREDENAFRERGPF